MLNGLVSAPKVLVEASGGHMLALNKLFKIFINSIDAKVPS